MKLIQSSFNGTWIKHYNKRYFYYDKAWYLFDLPKAVKIENLNLIKRLNEVANFN